jgi:hypothetical protein
LYHLRRFGLQMHVHAYHDGFVIKGDLRNTVTRSPWNGIIEVP